MKFIKNVTFIIVLILVCLATVGCDHPTYDDSTNDNSTTGNENVSSNDSESNNDNSPAPEEPAPPIWMLFSPLEKQITTDENLELKLFFIPPDYKEIFWPEQTQTKCKIWIQGYDKNNNPIKEKVALIKEYDIFTTDLYQKTYTSTGWLVSAIENIIVSPDWFSEDEGAISFFIDMSVDFSGEHPPRYDRSSIYFSYVKENDTIHLSSPYDFNENILKE